MEFDSARPGDVELPHNSSLSKEVASPLRQSTSTPVAASPLSIPFDSLTLASVSTEATTESTGATSESTDPPPPSIWHNLATKLAAARMDLPPPPPLKDNSGVTVEVGAVVRYWNAEGHALRGRVQELHLRTGECGLLQLDAENIPIPGDLIVLLSRNVACLDSKAADAAADTKMADADAADSKGAADAGAADSKGAGAAADTKMADADAADSKGAADAGAADSKGAGAAADTSKAAGKSESPNRRSSRTLESALVKQAMDASKADASKSTDSPNSKTKKDTSKSKAAKGGAKGGAKRSLFPEPIAKDRPVPPEYAADDGFDYAGAIESQLDWIQCMAQFIIHPKSDGFSLDTPGRVEHLPDSALYDARPSYVHAVLPREDMLSDDGPTPDAVFVPMLQLGAPADMWCVLHAVSMACDYDEYFKDGDPDYFNIGTSMPETAAARAKTRFARDMLARDLAHTAKLMTHPDVHASPADLRNWRPPCLDEAELAEEKQYAYEQYQGLCSALGWTLHLRAPVVKLEAKLRSDVEFNMDYNALAAGVYDKRVVQFRYVSPSHDNQPWRYHHRLDCDRLSGLVVTHHSSTFYPDGNSAKNRPPDYSDDVQGRLLSTVHYIRSPSSKIGHEEVLLPASNFFNCFLNHPAMASLPTRLLPFFYWRDMSAFFVPYLCERSIKDKAIDAAATRYARVGLVVRHLDETTGKPATYLVVATWIRLSRSVTLESLKQEKDEARKKEKEKMLALLQATSRVDLESIDEDGPLTMDPFTPTSPPPYTPCELVTLLKLPSPTSTHQQIVEFLATLESPSTRADVLKTVPFPSIDPALVDLDSASMVDTMVLGPASGADDTAPLLAVKQQKPFTFGSGFKSLLVKHLIHESRLSSPIESLKKGVAAEEVARSTVREAYVEFMKESIETADNYHCNYKHLDYMRRAFPGESFQHDQQWAALLVAAYFYGDSHHVDRAAQDAEAIANEADEAKARVKSKKKIDAIDVEAESEASSTSAFSVPKGVESIYNLGEYWYHRKAPFKPSEEAMDAVREWHGENGKQGCTEALALFQSEFSKWIDSMKLGRAAFEEWPRDRVTALCHKGNADWIHEHIGPYVDDADRKMWSNVQSRITLMQKLFALHDHVAYAMVFLEKNDVPLMSIICDKKKRAIWPYNQLMSTFELEEDKTTAASSDGESKADEDQKKTDSKLDTGLGARGSRHVNSDVDMTNEVEGHEDSEMMHESPTPPKAESTPKSKKSKSGGSGGTKRKAPSEPEPSPTPPSSVTSAFSPQASVHSTVQSTAKAAQKKLNKAESQRKKAEAKAEKIQLALDAEAERAKKRKTEAEQAVAAAKQAEQAREELAKQLSKISKQNEQMKKEADAAKLKAANAEAEAKRLRDQLDSQLYNASSSSTSVSTQAAPTPTQAAPTPTQVAPMPTPPTQSTAIVPAPTQAAAAPSTAAPMDTSGDESESKLMAMLEKVLDKALAKREQTSPAAAPALPVPMPPTLQGGYPGRQDAGALHQFLMAGDAHRSMDLSLRQAVLFGLQYNPFASQYPAQYPPR